MKTNFLALSFTVLSVLLITTVACEKEYKTRECPEAASQLECGVDSNAINVRVVNSTGYPLCDFEIDFETNVEGVDILGKLSEGEETCFSIKGSTKFYPELKFTLGTKTFKIPDTLTTDTLPYRDLVLTGNGFYTYNVVMGGPLDEGIALTVISTELP